MKPEIEKLVEQSNRIISDAFAESRESESEGEYDETPFCPVCLDFVLNCSH